MNENPRRLLLRLSAKLLSAAALVVVVYVLLSSVETTPEPVPVPPSLRIPVQANEYAPLQRINWQGGKLLLIWRSERVIASLAENGSSLNDPDSQEARQPADLTSPSRSRRPELFLAYDRGTGMGCPLKWMPSGSSGAPHTPWPGGLRDSCDGSWYDAAGRVFKGQSAGRNLDIPPYRFVTTDLIEVGRSGDNPAPAE